MIKKYAIAIHGGAGTILRTNMTNEIEKKYKTALNESILAGENILLNSGLAIDAVEASIRSLENNPLFNAGRGSVFSHEGEHDEDIRDMGRISAQMFDHIIIRQDKFLRGRKADDIVKLLVEGIHQQNPKQSYEYIPKEVEALKHALSLAKPGTFITALSDVIDNAIDLVQSYLDKERDL